MKIIEKKYDFIFYPANLVGCVSAIQKKNEGAEVLLLNDYGFPGGEITHSLCCHQFINEKLISGTTLKIYNQIVEEKYGLLYKYQEQVLLNPESVKYSLQQNLEQSKVDLLFHVIPFKISDRSNFRQIHLSAKEGELVCGSNKIIDCSENYSIIKLLGKKRKLIKANFNLFITKSGSNNFEINRSIDPEVVKYRFVEKFVGQFNLRYWISLNVSVGGQELFLENESQKILNEYEIYLQTKGARVQLIAPQTYKLYKSETLPNFNESIFHVNSLIGENFEIEYNFVKSSLIESTIIKIS